MSPTQRSVLVGAIAMAVAGIPGMPYFDLIPDHLPFLNVALGAIASPLLGGIVAARSYESWVGLSAEPELEIGRSRLQAGPVLGVMAAAIGFAVSSALNAALSVAGLGIRDWISSVPRMQEASLGAVVTATAVIGSAVAVHCLAGAVGGALGARTFRSGGQNGG